MAEVKTLEEYKAISKEIKRLMQEGKLEEALELCTDEYCKQNQVIQNQKINIMFKLKKLDEIILECDKAYEIWKDEMYIQFKLMAVSQIIKRLKQVGKYEEALELCTDEYCKQTPFIETQKIDIMFKLEKLEEIILECGKAYEIWKDKKYIRYKLMAVSQIIKRLMQEKKYKESLELCTDKYCKQEIFIQNQKIDIMFKLKKLEEIILECDKAYEIWKDKIFIQFKLMAVSQIIKRLMQEGKYEEALELCTDENCKQDEVIQTQKEKILSHLVPQFTQEEKQQLNEILIEKPINVYLTKIYFNDIEIEELDSLSSNLWESIILHLAYYEKKNKKMGLLFLKNIISKVELTGEQKKTINRLKERLCSKRNLVFDCGLYCEILKCNIDFQYIPKQSMNQDLVQNVITSERKNLNSLAIKKEECPKLKNKPKMVVQEGKRRNRFNTYKNNSKENRQQSEQTLLIKDVFSKELLEIKKYVYREMNWGTNQNGAVRVWDTLEILEEKEVKDRVSYHKILRIIDICMQNQVIQFDTQYTRKLKNYEEPKN